MSTQLCARVVVSLSIIIGLSAVALNAHAAPPQAKQATQATQEQTQDPPQIQQCSDSPEVGSNVRICPVGPVNAGPDGAVDVPTGPSLAATAVKARPVGPGTLSPTIPAGDALVNRVAGDAVQRLAGHRLVTEGRPDPDVHKLIPATANAGILDLPGGTQAELERVSAFIRDRTGFDPMAVWRALPEGIPLLTYRLCAETATRAVSCSVPRPLAVPVIADVTGDGTPDVLADLLPAVDVQPVITLSNELNGILRDIASVQRELDLIIQILKDPLQAPKHLWAAARKLLLEGQLRDLNARRADREATLRLRIAAGLGLVSARLPTSETRGGPLKAQLWAQYDVPAALDFSEFRRLSFGYDGFRRGASLSGIDWGVFTADIVAAARGIVDVRGNLCRHEPGDSIATVAGLAKLESRNLVEPTLVSALQTPVPEKLSVRAVVDTNTQQTRAELTASEPARVHALALTNLRAAQPYKDRFTEVIVDKLPTETTVELTRSTADGRTRSDVRFTSSASIDRGELHDYAYTGTRLEKVMSGAATALPTRLEATVTTADQSSTLSYRANEAAAKTVDALFFDRAAARTVAEAHMERLPASLDFALDQPTHHLTLGTSSAIGLIAAILQRAGGAITTPAGEHATLISDGAVQGFSGRVTGLRSFDITYGGHPHALVNVEPGGQPFLGWGSIDRTHLARVDVTNLPPTVEVDMDPAARTAKYRASAVVNAIQAAYTNTQAGPTIDGRIEQVPTSVDASFTLGDVSQLKLTSSAKFARAEAYFSPDHVTAISPGAGRDLYGDLRQVPTKVTLDVDVPNSHLEWTGNDVIDSVFAWFRGPMAGRNWTLAGDVADLPSKLVADFPDGFIRVQAPTERIGRAEVALTNHPGAVAPTGSGSHLAGHFRQSTGDLDASVLAKGLKSAEYSRTPHGFKVSADAAKESTAVDADAVLNNGNRFGALGRFSHIPGSIEIAAPKDQPLTYTGDGTVDVRAKIWLGKVAGIGAISGAPDVGNGISLVERGCQIGPGCPADDGPFCVAKGCFGLAGFINMTNLPTKVTIDAGRKIYALYGFRPEGKSLRLYLDGDRVFAPGQLTGFKALAELSGLPEQLSVTIGPIETGDTTKIEYGSDVDSNARLKLHAEADNVPRFGNVRTIGELASIPRTVKITGEVGAETDLTVANSDKLSRLYLRASGTFDGQPGSAVLDLTDVPSSTRWIATGFGEKPQNEMGSISLPTVRYIAKDKAGGTGPESNGLSGSVIVEAPVIKLTSNGTIIRADDLQLKVTRLGNDTSLSFDTTHKRASLISDPVTEGIKIVGSLFVRIGRIEIPEQKLADCGFNIHAELLGHFELKDSRIEDVTVDVHDVSRLFVEPGKPQKEDLPAEIGYIFQAIDGTYGRIDVSTSGVNLDVDLKVEIKTEFFGRDGGVTYERLGRFDRLRMHRYDLDHKSDIKIDINNFPDLNMKSRPGLAQDPPPENAITIPGQPSKQMVTLIEPTRAGDDQEGLDKRKEMLKLLSNYFWPFGGRELEGEDEKCQVDE